MILVVQTFIEQYRQLAVDNLFSSGETVKDCFPYWKSKFQAFLPIDAANFYKLGEHLREISFYAGEQWYLNCDDPNLNKVQAMKSRAGTSMEILTSYYLNLGLIGSNAVAIKAKKNVWPQCLQDATTLVHNNRPIKSENDIVVTTFPDHPDFNTPLPEVPKKDFTKKLNELTEKHFTDIDVGIVQTKTNWADNVQSILLYIIIYGAGTKYRIPGVSLGINGWNLNDLKGFTYSFVTMPSQKDLNDFKPSTTAVVRVSKLTGGNYWGVKSKAGVASNLNEIFNKNFSSSFNGISHRNLLGQELKKISTDYSYFDFC